MSASSQDPDEVTTTVTMGPPKSQVTIPIEARRALGIDGKRALLEITVNVTKVLDEDDGGEF